MRIKNIAKVAVTAGLAFGLIAAGASAAQADPTSGSGLRTYSAAGSDTIQDLYNAYSNGYTAASGHVDAAASSIASYDAFNATLPITPKSGGATFNRPAGSGDGVKALSASWRDAANRSFTDAAGATWKLRGPNATTANLAIHEVDIARSSSRPSAPVDADPSATSTDKLTFIPLARDAVSVAVQGTTAPADFSTAELHAIFLDGTFSGTVGRITTAGNGSTDPVYTDPVTHVVTTLHPELPQASSGTRSFFLKAIGQLSGETIGTWVEQANAPENNATSLATVGDVSPFSAAQWIAQKNGIATSTFGGTNGANVHIASIGGAAAVAGSGTSLTPGALYGALTSEPSADAGTFARDVYSVIPTSKFTGGTDADSTLVNLLTNQLRNASYEVSGIEHVVLNDFGFAKLVYTPNEGEYHSNWTN